MVSCHQVCFFGSEYNPQSGIPVNWFLPYKDPCNCTAIRLGGMSISASSSHQGAPYYLNDFFLSEDCDEIHAHFNCTPAEKDPECASHALGMEDGTIPDDRIKASSEIYTDCCPAVYARLNSNKRWIPSNTDANPWIEVDLIGSTVVIGVITQGWMPPSSDPQYVAQYKVSYQKQPSSDYDHVADRNGNIKVFIGNTDDHTPVTNLFDESVVVTVVRIEPTEWQNLCSLRLELLGCRHD
ncbi:lactadherin-like [Patiria miniata]|uniref:F5/8 type C domain-containing protein n=1 Tax=Patiria miniata TaxID=46514 RepID=A0A914AAG4_PATMI|nr:lactadherin-like [Patiria miniata]